MRIATAAFSAVFALALGAGGASAVTVDPSSTMTDSVLSNRKADGSVNMLSSAPHSWLATFDKTDRGGRAIFKFVNDTGSDQIVTVALQALLDGLGGKFRHGITAKWAGGERIRLRGKSLDTVTMTELFSIGETGRLRISFSRPITKKHSTPGLKVNVTSADKRSKPDENSGATPSPAPGIPPVTEVDSGPSAAPAAVPLPAGWFLSVTALAGLGLLGTRKRRSQAL